MSELYVFTDDNSKTYDEVLAVDFLFPNGTKVEDAIKQIDMLVSLADNNDEIEFYDHKPTMYVMSPLQEPDEDLYM
jgi:hypothetical protein|tara:strand:- start:198 stop:425 length:228 start_codon:yes stop_codon:yes gene_type:complete